MNKLILSTLLAVGVVCAKEHCELVERKTYLNVNYESITIICKEVPNVDSVLYYIHLSHKHIDQLVIWTSKNDLIIEDAFDIDDNKECTVWSDTTDEYGIVIGESDKPYSFGLCKHKFKYYWNKLKRLGTYK